MYDPQDDEATREAEAVDATDMSPTVMSAPGSGAVVDALAWSQEDGSAGAEPVPYVEDPYDHDLGTGRRPTVVVPAATVPGRRAPSRLPRIALGFGILVALVAVIGAIYSLTRGHDEAPVAPETSSVLPPAPSPSAPPPPPPPVATTSAVPPPVTTTEPPPTTTTVPPTTTTTTTTAPPTTTTTTAPPTTTTTTAPPTTTAPSSSAEPPTTTVPMTTEYLTIPFVPVPIPITVPQN